MAVTKTVSTNAKWIIYSGTYVDVIDAMDAEGVPEHKIRGFASTSAGECIALVHKR